MAIVRVNCISWHSQLRTLHRVLLEQNFTAHKLCWKQLVHME